MQQFLLIKDRLNIFEAAFLRAGGVVDEVSVLFVTTGHSLSRESRAV
jgi:hypothetical protein